MNNNEVPLTLAPTPFTCFFVTGLKKRNQHIISESQVLTWKLKSSTTFEVMAIKAKKMLRTPTHTEQRFEKD